MKLSAEPYATLDVDGRPEGSPLLPALNAGADTGRPAAVEPASPLTLFSYPADVPNPPAKGDTGPSPVQFRSDAGRHAGNLSPPEDLLADTIELSRKINAAIRRLLLYTLPSVAAGIAAMLTGPFLALPLQLPARVLWFNLLTSALLGLSLVSERRPVAAPHQAHAWAGQRAGTGMRIVRLGVMVWISTMAVAAWAGVSGLPGSTMAFCSLGLSQLGIAIAHRGVPTLRVSVSVLAALTLEMLAIYLPPFNRMLGSVPLPPPALGLVLVASATGYFGARLDRRLHPER